MNNNQLALLELVRAGLWDAPRPVSRFTFQVSGDIDWERVYQLAEEQNVVGLIAAGIDGLNIEVPLELKLQIIGEALQIEQRNKEMNAFIADTVEKMREADIYTLLVKGQGIAQCYERPLWRTSGDIDLFLSDSNYEKAKKFFVPLSSGGKPERKFSKEWGLNVGSWYVELHGTQRTGLSTRLDKVIDDVQGTVFNEGKVRSWMNGDTQIFLPGVNEDVFFVFTHLIKHFYKEGGVSIRQLCDWCRLLWTYKETIDASLLETRLNRSGLMGEWKGFAAVAVNCLGMPIEAMSLFNENDNHNANHKRKAERILAFILKEGEWQRFKDTLTVGRIFPLSTFMFLPGILLSVTWLKIKERVFGEG